jgi:hypothetical protein
MVATRKVCVNFEQIQAAHNINTQLDYAGERFAPRHPIPQPVYAEASFNFRNMSILDWMVDPQSKEKDIIIWLQHRGEMRFAYDLALETKLTNIFAALE